jgi:hypothetical protein
MATKKRLVAEDIAALTPDDIVARLDEADAEVVVAKEQARTSRRAATRAMLNRIGRLDLDFLKRDPNMSTEQKAAVRKAMSVLQESIGSLDGEE